MAFPCVLGYKAECDGCGACTEERIAGQCDECKEDIFEGILLHEDCLLDYVRLFRRTAEYME